MLSCTKPWSLLSLQPRKDVRRESGGFCATSDDPWLAAPFELDRGAGRLLVFRYGDSRLAAPERPRLRFMRADGSCREHLLPGVTGEAALWFGRCPPDVREIWISPRNRPGPFDFHLEYAPDPWRAAGRARHSPKRLFFAVSAAMIGLEDEAELNWRWALGQEPLSRYALWSAERDREPCGSAPEGGPRFWAFVNVDDATSDAIDATCGSLMRQGETPPAVRFHGTAAAQANATLAEWKRQPGCADASAGERPGATDFVVMLRAGDALARDALAIVSAYLARQPQHALVFADEYRKAGGDWLPVLKPGWSPVFQRFSGYLGRAAFFAGRLTPQKAWLDKPAHEIIDEIAGALAGEEIGALRRPLFFIAEEDPAPARPKAAARSDMGPPVSVIIPTRDRADLLENCLASLFERTTYLNYNVTLVDNDSAETRTHALIDRFRAAEPRFSVLSAPGDFNFSALSNAGAQASGGDYLVFLNNDTQIVTPDWIERLLYFAARPDVGAVGAKLLYPGGATQHVGVVLGMGGVAGHFGAGLAGTAPGWLGQNLVPHEASAVTGACLMVERRKFDAVGRFDAVNLPVDLNDIDLCLRLRAAGWRSVCNCEAVLIHHESASRGGGMRLQKVYARERRYFQERWQGAIRDDPYFHPGLSLYSAVPALP